MIERLRTVLDSLPLCGALAAGCFFVGIAFGYNFHVCPGETVQDGDQDEAPANPLEMLEPVQQDAPWATGLPESSPTEPAESAECGDGLQTPIALLLAVALVESNATHADASGAVTRGARGELGMMQIAPVNFAACGGEGVVRSLDCNIRCADLILSGWLVKTNGNKVQALCAYNTGKPLRECEYARKVLAQLSASASASANTNQENIP